MTKNKPLDLYFNYESYDNNKIIDNIKESQKNVNKHSNYLKKETKILF